MILYKFGNGNYFGNDDSNIPGCKPGFHAEGVGVGCAWGCGVGGFKGLVGLWGRGVGVGGFKN